MNIENQIRIVNELIEATEELNGEFQDGWDKTIENGTELLKHLMMQQHSND